MIPEQEVGGTCYGDRLRAAEKWLNILEHNKARMIETDNEEIVAVLKLLIREIRSLRDDVNSLYPDEE